MTELIPSPSHIIGPTWQRTADGGFYLPEKTLGLGVVNWLYTYVRQPGGKFAGEPFVPTDEQFRFILWWYAVDDNGNFVYRDGVLRRLKGWGKDPLAAALALVELCGPVRFSHWDSNGNPVGKPCHAAWVQVAAVSQEQPLALDTEVPTPFGWTTVGNLHVGDYVIGSDGKSHRVQRETEVFEDLDCYTVRFDDGTEVVASAGHGWTTERLNGHGDKYETVTVTTEELKDTCRGSKNRKRHRIPVVGYDSPSVTLPVDPWFLGLWLGDGAAADTQVAFDWRLKGEYEVLFKEILEDFQELYWWNDPESNTGVVRIKNIDRTRDSESVRHRLRELGVLGNKHIPLMYMQAGTEQRRELLRGLIDSDGGVDKNGRAYFVNTNHDLVRSFQELAVGLGFRCTVRKHDNGAFQAEFNPGTRFPVAKLSAKRGNQKPYSNRTRSQHRWVESVTPVESVPVKCIGIDTADHLFQVTRSRVLTHNTKNTFALFPVMISKEMKEEYHLDVNKFIIYADEGAKRIESVTASPASMEGNRPTFVIKNEVQWWGAGPDGTVNEGLTMSEVIAGNVTKIEHSRALAICNAHIPGYGTVAELDYDLWCDIQSGKAIDPGLLYDALEAPADTPVSEIPSLREDPEGYERGVAKLREGVITARGDAHWLPVDEIVDSILDARKSVIESRRKFLNQINAAEDSWIAPYEWDACQPETPLEPLKKKDRITLGFDGSKSNDWTALVACRVSDGALFLLHAWDPERYQTGEIPRDEVDSVVRSAMATYDVVAFRADVYTFEAYVDQWTRDFGKKMKVPATPGKQIAFDMRGQTKQFSLDCERFVGAVLDKELFHNGDPMMRQHILNAKRHPTTYDTISIRKESKDSSRKIDIAVCCVLAFGARQDFLVSKNNKPTGATVHTW